MFTFALRVETVYGTAVDASASSTVNVAATEPSPATVLGVAVMVQVVLLAPASMTAELPHVVLKRGPLMGDVKRMVIPPTGAGTFEVMVQTAT